MDLTEFDASCISAEQLNVSEERWARYIEMMDDCGYIKGAKVEHMISGSTYVDLSDVRITLAGLEYLQENTIMQKLYRTAKGIKDLVK